MCICSNIHFWYGSYIIQYKKLMNIKLRNILNKGRKIPFHSYLKYIHSIWLVQKKNLYICTYILRCMIYKCSVKTQSNKVVQYAQKYLRNSAWLIALGFHPIRVLHLRYVNVNNQREWLISPSCYIKAPSRCSQIILYI